MEHCIPFAVFSGSTAPAEPSPTKPGPEAVAAASPKARGPLADIKREAAKQQRNSSTSSRLGSMFVEESRAPAGTNGGDSGDDGDGADDDGDGGDNEDGNDMDGEIGGEQRRVSIDSGAGKAKGPMSPRARPGQVGEGRGGGGGAGKGDDDEVDEEREGSVAGSAVSDSVVSETGGRGGGAAMVAEDDVPGLDLLEHETAQVRERDVMSHHCSEVVCALAAQAKARHREVHCLLSFTTRILATFRRCAPASSSASRRFSRRAP